MKNNFPHKRILVLGGPGLVGRNVIESLISRGARGITAVGLPQEAGWRELLKIERKHRVRIRKYAVNLLVPPDFQRQMLSYILSRPGQQRRLAQMVTVNVTSAEAARQPMAKIFRACHPHLVVDCVNTATQCAYIDQVSDDIQNAGIGSLLLLRYYQVLFHLLRRNSERKPNLLVEKYLKVGTTGIGGMGLDIPFTHGEKRPSISLLKKVAMAGAQTNILLAMRNSHGIADIQEIVPATSIFQVSGFTPTDKAASVKRKRKLTEIDGGESRGYALEEFRLLTDPKEMGLIDARELADIIINAIQTGRSSHDVLRALDHAGVGSSNRSVTQRESVLRSWTRDLNRRKDWSIAHGNLGPWRTRKLLFEITLMLAALQKHGRQFWHMSLQRLQSELLSLLRADVALGQEIRTAKLRVVSTGVLSGAASTDRRIDLSINNLKRWKRALRGLRAERLQTGDILAALIAKHHDLRAIP